MRRLLLFMAVFFLAVSGYSRRQQETWQDYLSFSNATKVAVAGSRIYCATEGGLFYFDRDDNSIQKFSGVNGLTDFGIQTIAWSKNNKVLIVAYKNSNIDLVYGSEVLNLSDIKRKQVTGDKNIYNISFSGDEAYLSCGFGIVVLNLAGREVKDTYFIGKGGTSLRVNDVAVLNSRIYAATNEGILYAQKENQNLLDFRNWNLEESIPHPNSKFSQLAIHAGTLWANYMPADNGKNEIYRFDGRNWHRYFNSVYYSREIQVTDDYMIITGGSDIYLIDEQNQIAGKINSYQLEGNEISPMRSRSASLSEDGSIWIADYENGLIRGSGENFESIFPNGPMENEIFNLTHSNSVLWIAPGSTKGWERPRFQYFKDGYWKYFTQNDHPELDGFHNVVNIVVDPFDENHFFVSTWGGGVLEYRNDEFVQRYTNLNSPLQTALPEKPNEPFVRVLGMDFDEQGNLWMTNSEVAKNLLKLSPEGEWESFVLPEVANRYNLGSVVVTENNDKWVIVLSGHDAYVVNADGSQKKRLLVTSYFNNGKYEEYNRMNDLYCITEDLEGAIWIGTSKGVAVYNSPWRIWDSETFYAIQPSLDLNDGLYHPLLETETVTAITVDGANRKWIGTRGSGVFLVSENGEEEILHFTSDNSPLLSNNITDIAINQLTGEVFIGTSEGLISYQGDAIEGKDAYADVYVYPNPVRETYDGPVTVTGLIENTDVKITDISGNLVYQSASLGGQAVWDGKNLNGNRVRTGVYLVFCTDEFGEETHIEKLLFIN